MKNYLLTEIEDSLPELNLLLSETVHSVINRVVGETSLLKRVSNMWEESDNNTCLEDLAVRRRARAREREPDSTILALKRVLATKT